MTCCRARYEPVPDHRLNETHTCCRLADHDGPHLCPVCRNTWNASSTSDTYRAERVTPR